MAIELDIVARSKRVPWGGASGEADIVILGFDYSAATFKMEIRPEPGDSAAALLTLNNASAGSEGVSASYDAGYVHPETGAVVGATRIRPQINEATMEGLSTGSPVDEPVEAFYDLHLTPSGGVKMLYLFGRWSYHPGVTR